MPRNKARIADLQQGLAMELSAVQQYLLHAHVLEDWGLDQQLSLLERMGEPAFMQTYFSGTGAEAGAA